MYILLPHSHNNLHHQLNYNLLFTTTVLTNKLTILFVCVCMCVCRYVYIHTYVCMYGLVPHIKHTQSPQRPCNIDRDRQTDRFTYTLSAVMI